jgi:hypothetical protein
LIVKVLQDLRRNLEYKFKNPEMKLGDYDYGFKGSTPGILLGRVYKTGRSSEMFIDVNVEYPKVEL